MSQAFLVIKCCPQWLHVYIDLDVVDEAMRLRANWKWLGVSGR